MKRSRLNRGTSRLRRRARLRSKTELQRRTPLREVSKRAQAAGKPVRRDTGPDRSTRELVLERDHFQCAWCGRTILGQQYSIQHRRARGDGGSSDPRINAPSNLVTLCGSATSPGGCHLKCEQRSTVAEVLGFVVSLNSIHDPADIPVRHAVHGIVFLLDDGTWEPASPLGDAA